MTSQLDCGVDGRRAKLRASGRNGFDAVEVSADQRELTVLLFGETPDDLRKENFRVLGGRRVTGVEVIALTRLGTEEPDLEDRIRLTVDRIGDFSTYTLIAVDAETGKPHPCFDPRYARIDFSFKQNCPTDLDCKAAPPAPGPERRAPTIDYLAKDYASFRQLMLDRLSLTIPQWTDRHVPDVGLTLVELLAYVGDQLSYRQDAVATEAYLDTARERISVRRHVRLMDYPMHDGCAARTTVHVAVDGLVELSEGDYRFIALDPDVLYKRHALRELDLLTNKVPPESYEVYRPLVDGDLTLREPHNKIPLWTWGGQERFLPKGSTAATLKDDWADEKCERRLLSLEPGDLLLFEEVLGPNTGKEADADPSHRQVVRLTSVEESVDPLYDDQPLLEVTWAPEDALTFPLCLSSRDSDCCEVENVSVARGNMVLVEHGRPITWCDGKDEEICVPERDTERVCPERDGFGCDDQPVEVLAYPPISTPFRVMLKQSPVTQRAAFGDYEQIAERQADILLRIPEQVRERVRELWKAVRGGHRPTKDEIAELTLVFGAKPLRRVRKYPLSTLVRLLSDFDELLHAKLRRVRLLARRARCGVVLDDGVVAEIEQSWNDDLGHQLHPDRSLFLGPVVDALRPDARTALPDVVLTDGCETWTPRRDLLGSSAYDRHFVGELDDEGKLWLRFGDGVHGKAPEPGSMLVAHYWIGNGAAGNVGREAITRLVCRNTDAGGVLKVRNPLAARGGTEPEPLSQVRDRAPVEPRLRLLRAIIAEDYAALAGQVPGVQRAAASLRWTGSWYEAQVGLDPAGGTEPSEALIDAVRDRLRRYRRIGHDLLVGPAKLVPLHIEMEICVASNHIASHVRAAVLRAMKAFFHPDNLTFGTPVRMSAVVAAAAAVPGVRGAWLTKFQRQFAPPNGELENGVLPISDLEVAQLDNDPVRPENGKLVVRVGGGR
ncbi:putative baseplate assembly protein [Allokutzneria sp. A3M-2-11 16]|uniref:putative baseplate assembly protein n=1 Tax=Allokutzneria sp. A3M-2-11 16 TaxID=2962043 RepID=UPI0020B8F462|nr:putative baseplate assembly protein [Allokutzneria sp. A3M-2-11 16]MCP3804188.1 putative baseplate assembly protein [Allokutzneria sp. A3M-2-11 16]